MNASRTLPLRAGIVVGIALAVVGVGAYVVTDFASFTALIPALFGVVFVALGRVGIETGRERVATYALGVLSILGIGGSTRGLAELPALVSGGSVESPTAVASQGLMALLCLVVLATVAMSLFSDRA